MKKWILFLSFAVISTIALSQKIKKKYFGTYAGSIPAYIIELDETALQVRETSVEIQLISNEKAKIDLNGIQQEGKLLIISSDKKTLRIHFITEENSIPEEWILNKKTKLIERKGAYPQPSCELKKRKK